LILAIVLPKIREQQEALETYPVVSAKPQLYAGRSGPEKNASFADHFADAEDAEATTFVDADGLLIDRQQASSTSQRANGGDSDDKQESATAPQPEPPFTEDDDPGRDRF
jgi:hypothetical protein